MLIVAALLLLLLLALCTVRAEPPHNIVIDGDFSDWADVTSHLGLFFFPEPRFLILLCSSRTSALQTRHKPIFFLRNNQFIQIQQSSIFLSILFIFLLIRCNTDPDDDLAGTVLQDGIPDCHDTNHKGKCDIPSHVYNPIVNVLEYKFTHDETHVYV